MQRANLKTADFLQGLNPAQRQAVLHEDGPLLILAGAGSGKTRVLTHRIAKLLSDGVAATSILAVTFTNKAAGEMKERVAELTGLSEYDMPLVSTFHSFCVRLLRSEIEAEGYNRDFTIYDEKDQLGVVKTVMKERHVQAGQVKPRSVGSIISRWKNDGHTPIQATDIAQSYLEEIAAEVYEGYQEELKKANALDFDDLLLIALRLLSTHPDILKKYQKRFNYILVDEYQDTNVTQYKLVSLLAAEHRNLCVVGDDWQSIYGWRGADIQNILNFEKDYPDATTIRLEQNYRSTQHILDSADHVIKQNTSQKEKRLYTEAGDGEKIRIVEARDAYDEARVVARDLTSRIKEGEKLDESAVLYRTNAQSRVLEHILLEQNISYRIVGGVRFYDRKEVKDVLGYLRLIQNPNDLAGLQRIINEPRRGIGEKTLAALVTFARSTNRNLMEGAIAAKTADELSQGMRTKLSGFGNIMRHLQQKAKELPLSELLQEIARESGMRDALKDGTDEGEARWENILELAGSAKRYDDEKEEGIAMFLEEVALISDLDKTDETGDAVTLMTVHNAKGLEFHNVYVVGCEEGIFPHSRTFESPPELEEETRLCYVAMTRAKRRLFMMHCVERELYGTKSMNEPSRFITNLPLSTYDKLNSGDFRYAFSPSRASFEGFRKRGQDRTSALDEAYQESYEGESIQVDDEFDSTMWNQKGRSAHYQNTFASAPPDSASQTNPNELKSGQSVEHPTFGRGVVVSCRNNTLTIAFAKFGLKRLDLEHTNVEIV